MRQDDDLGGATLIGRVAAVAFPGLGCVGGLDARLVADLYLGAEGGGFSGAGNEGLWFTGGRASYRLRVPGAPALRVVPSVGLVHAEVFGGTVSAARITRQNPVSPTVGLQLSVMMGAVLMGAWGEFIPIQLTEARAPDPAKGAEGSRVRSLYGLPLGLFAALAF